MPFETLPPNAKKLAKLIVDIQAEVSKSNPASVIGWPKFDELLKTITDGIGDVLDSVDLGEIIGASFDESKVETASNDLLKMIDAVFNNAFVEEMAELFGTAVMGPFLSLMTRYADDPESNPEEFAAAFHGLSILITLPEFLADMFQGSVVGTVIGRFGGAFKSMYWNLGLGFLGWQTLAPFLSAGLQPRLERHFNNKFRTKRFSFTELVALYNIGSVSAGELIQSASEEGWRAKDIQTVIENSYRTLSDSDIKMLYKKGVLNRAAALTEVLKQGYNPLYASYILNDIIYDVEDDSKSVSLTNARKAFKLGLRSLTEFKSILKQLGYSDAAIALEVDIAQAEVKDNQRELTVGQLKSAYVKNQITQTELNLALRELGYAGDDAILLINTFNAEKAPKILKVNQATIKQALITGILSTTKAIDRLVSLGYTNPDAELIVNTALASIKITRKPIGVDKLITGLALAAIDDNTFTTQLKVQGYTDNDITIFRAIAKRESPSALSITDIHYAYINGSIDEQSVLSELGKIGGSAGDNQFRLNSWKAEKTNSRFKPSTGNLVLFYRQGLISGDMLIKQLQMYGFTAEEARLMRDSADLSYPKELSESSVKELFVLGVIDTGKASNLLKSIGYGSSDTKLLVDGYVALVGSSVPKPSVSSLMAAYYDGIITLEDFKERMADVGYLRDAIEFYVKLLEAGKNEVSEHLTKSDILGLVKDGLLPYTDGLERLIKMGYDPADAELLLATKKQSIAKSQVHQLFINGYINPDDYVDILISLGYTLEEINEYLDSML